MSFFEGYINIFCGLIEPFPRLRVIEKSPDADQDEVLDLTKKERDFYRSNFLEAKAFIKQFAFSESNWK